MNKVIASLVIAGSLLTGTAVAQAGPANDLAMKLFDVTRNGG
jgi:hypothetical protein